MLKYIKENKIQSFRDKAGVNKTIFNIAALFQTKIEVNLLTKVS